MRFRKGFTLAEIVISVGLLGVIIVIIAGVFVHGLHAIRKSRYRVVAMNIADKKCSELRELFLKNVPVILREEIKMNIDGTDSVSEDFYWGLGSELVTIDGNETVDNLTYRFSINIDEEGTVDSLKTVNVTVTWKEVDGDHKVFISTCLSRPSMSL